MMSQYGLTLICLILMDSYDSERKDEAIIRVININIEERKGLYQINRNGMHDLVKEVEELKQGVLMLLSNQQEGKKGEKND